MKAKSFYLVLLTPLLIIGTIALVVLQTSQRDRVMYAELEKAGMDVRDVTVVYVGGQAVRRLPESISKFFRRINEVNDYNWNGPDPLPLDYSNLRHLQTVNIRNGLGAENGIPNFSNCLQLREISWALKSPKFFCEDATPLNPLPSSSNVSVHGPHPT